MAPIIWFVITPTVPLGKACTKIAHVSLFISIAGAITWNFIIDIVPAIIVSTCLLQAGKSNGFRNKATSHYLNQYRPVHRRICAALGGDDTRNWNTFRRNQMFFRLIWHELMSRIWLMLWPGQGSSCEARSTRDIFAASQACTKLLSPWIQAASVKDFQNMNMGVSNSFLYFIVWFFKSHVTIFRKGSKTFWCHPFI